MDWCIDLSTFFSGFGLLIDIFGIILIATIDFKRFNDALYEEWLEKQPSDTRPIGDILKEGLDYQLKHGKITSEEENEDIETTTTNASNRFRLGFILIIAGFIFQFLSLLV